MLRPNFAARFRNMISPSFIRVFCFAVAVASASLSVAQDAYSREEGMFLSEDSLDVMTQMWHALP